MYLYYFRYFYIRKIVNPNPEMSDIDDTKFLIREGFSNYTYQQENILQQ